MNRQRVLENQSVPLMRCAAEERRTEHNCPEPPVPEFPNTAVANRSDGEVYGQTTGEQAGREEDWHPENIFRHRTIEAFADIEKIRNDENYKDGSFRCNQSEHSDAPA